MAIELIASFLLANPAGFTLKHYDSAQKFPIISWCQSCYSLIRVIRDSLFSDVRKRYLNCKLCSLWDSILGGPVQDYSSSSGASVTAACVVSSIPATLAALCRAEHTVLVGSSIPAATRSSSWPVMALNPTSSPFSRT